MNKDELVGLEIDHIKVNQPDLETILKDEGVCGLIAQLYAIHQSNPTTCSMLIKQQIDELIKMEAISRVENKYE